MPGVEGWQTMLKTGCLDNALQSWSSHWENYLLRRCQERGNIVQANQLGRARPLEQQIGNPPDVPLHRQGWPLELRQLQTTYNQIRGLLQEELAALPLDGWRIHIAHQQRRQSLASRVRRLHDLDFPYQEELALEQLQDQVQEQLTQLRVARRQEQITSWRRKMASFTQACRHTNFQTRQRLDAVRDSTGQLVHDIPAMDAALSEYWQRQDPSPSQH